MAMSREEILLEKPYLKDSKIYFRLTDLQKYLTKQSFTVFKTNKIASTLKEMGAKHIETSIKGESIRLWIIDYLGNLNAKKCGRPLLIIRIAIVEPLRKFLIILLKSSTLATF